MHLFFPVGGSIFGLKPGAKTYFDVILFLFAKIVLKRKVLALEIGFMKWNLSIYPSIMIKIKL